MYSALLFLHIVSAIGLFVIEGVALLALRELRAARQQEAARLALARVQVVEGLSKPLPILALLSGLGLCALVWGFATPWVLLSMGGFVGLALLIRLVDHPRLERVQRLVGEEQSMEQLQPALHDPVLRRGSRVRLGLLLWLVFLMTVKPALLLGLGAVLLVLAAALLLPMRASVTPTPSAA